MPEPNTGSAAFPVKQDPFQWIVGFSRGGGLGVLVVDAPDGVVLTFDPGVSLMAYHSAPYVITKDDLAKFEDSEGQHPAPVSLLVCPPMIVANLYGAGDKAWAVGRLMLGVGTDPGNWIFPFLVPTFPGSAYAAYLAEYNKVKAAWLLKPKARWIEVADLKSLGSDTLITGDARIYFGAGDSWQELNYGQVQTFWYETQPYVPPRYNAFGQIYQTVFHPGEFVDGNIGYAQQYDIHAQRLPAPWGIGETESAGNPGRNAVRHVYFLDFDVIKAGKVSVRQNNPAADPDLPSHSMVFWLRMFGRETKFTLGATAVTPDREPGYDQQKSFPYTQAGLLFEINRAGFVV